VGSSLARPSEPTPPSEISTTSATRPETYAGTQYFNRITAATEASREGRQLIRGRWVYRDRAEWIPVTVPAVVALQAAMKGFVAAHNPDPKPFVWRADPKAIVAAAKRGYQTLDSIHLGSVGWGDSIDIGRPPSMTT
jgi:hypothetical protein